MLRCSVRQFLKSSSTPSSLTSNPCSLILFINADTFCIAGGRSRDPVLILSSTSFALNPCWCRESSTEEIFCGNCVVAAPPPFDPISISMLNSRASSPCCFTVFSICDNLCDSFDALLYPVLNSISIFISGSGLQIIRYNDCTNSIREIYRNTNNATSQICTIRNKKENVIG
jgi:hypothetical protein